MAGLAELRHLALQELPMVAAMRGMAVQTVFIHRRMLPHDRPSFFGVALVAQVIKGIRLHHLGSEASMVVVTGRAF